MVWVRRSWVLLLLLWVHGCGAGLLDIIPFGNNRRSRSRRNNTTAANAQLNKQSADRMSMGLAMPEEGASAVSACAHALRSSGALSFRLFPSALRWGGAWH